MYLLNFHYFPFVSPQHTFPLLWACKCQAVSEILKNNESDVLMEQGVLNKFMGFFFFAQGLANWAPSFHTRSSCQLMLWDTVGFVVSLLHQTRAFRFPFPTKALSAILDKHGGYMRAEDSARAVSINLAGILC